MLSPKEKYRQFCVISKRPLIFQTPLWLDAVVGTDHWDVVLCFQGENMSGALPYVTSKKWGFHQITLPFLTFYLGPIVFYPLDLKRDNRISFQRKIIADLVAQIPKNDRFITHTDFEMDYWLPFYWDGYQQTTRYTYLLDTSAPKEEIYDAFKAPIKKAIVKSSSSFTIAKGNSPEAIFHLYQTDYNRKNLKTSFQLEDIWRVDRALAPTNNRIILEATDQNNKVIAAYYLVLDHTYVHYIFGAVDYEFRDSGVMSLLMWEAIQEAKKHNLKFNFGGSMNKNIEQFFSGFKGELTTYMRISKVSNKWLKPFTRFQL